MKKIGVIVARFQVPALHKGHVHFIAESAKRSDTLIIFLGYKVNQPDTKNPFSFEVRKEMIKQTAKSLGFDSKIIIDGMEDHPMSNQAWSEELDKKIEAYRERLCEKDKEEATVSLYGSRDSFISSYFGVHPTTLIDEVQAISGTLIRQQVLDLKEHELNDTHREGIIYGLKGLYQVGMSAVDIIVYKEVEGVKYLLLGRKKRETSLRLVGGFFDVNLDESLEGAALRELCEEAGPLTVTNLTYLGSKKVDDWRYKDNQHKIVSSCFLTRYIEGEITPNDDLEEVSWVRLEDVKGVTIVKNHQEFIQKALTFISGKI